MPTTCCPPRASTRSTRRRSSTSSSRATPSTCARPLLEPLPGTLPEPEIWARLVRELGVIGEDQLGPLRAAAARGPRGLRRRRWRRRSTADPGLGQAAALRALRDARPDAARRMRRRSRPVGPGAALRDDLPRCGAAGRATPTATRCSTRCSPSRSGITFTVDEYEDDFSYVAHADKRIALEIPELLDDLRALADEQRGLDQRRVPARALGRRAPRVHRQRHLPRPVLAQARRRWRAAGERRGRRALGLATATGRGS